MGTMFWAALATVVPTLVYTLSLWWLDRYEKEPLGLLAAAFFWGSVPAVVLTLFFARLVGDIHDPALIAPLVEEPLKALALVLLFVFVRREFDGVLDGIIYGALIGFGFAMTENAIYFSQVRGSLSLLIWLRVVLLGLGHAFFTSIVGVAFGLVRYDHRRWVHLVALFAALALAIAFHGLSNRVVSHHLLGLVVAWTVQSGGVLVVLLVAVLSWRHERSWIDSELRDEVTAGFLSYQEYRVIRSSALRMQAQLHALLDGGWRRFRCVRRLHHLLTELALLKYQLRIGDRFFCPDDLDELRRDIERTRSSLALSALNHADRTRSKA